MKVTVILCTYNRCGTLETALNSLNSLKVPTAVEWDVLVVDNASTDGTQKIVRDFCDGYPDRFRYLFEPQRGKSHALNRGIREARGEVLAFVDDDVTMDAHWLGNLTAALRDPVWAGAGGRILPAQSISPPRWLALDGPYSMASMLFAGFDLGDNPRQLDRPPYGTNMAFKKEMFDKYGGFRTDLGPGPGSEIRGEDTEFGGRLIGAGERLRYEPSAVVYHELSENRLTKDFLLAWWFDDGRASIRKAGRRQDIWGIPRYCFSIPKAMVGISLLGLKWMLALNPQRRFFLRCRAWYLTGQLVEIYRRRTAKKVNDAAGVNA